MANRSKNMHRDVLVCIIVWALDRKVWGDSICITVRTLYNDNQLGRLVVVARLYILCLSKFLDNKDTINDCYDHKHESQSVLHRFVCSDETAQGNRPIGSGYKNFATVAMHELG